MRPPLFRAAVILTVAFAGLFLARQRARLAEPVVLLLNGHAVTTAQIRLGVNDVMSIVPAARGARIRYLVEIEIDRPVLIGEAGADGALGHLRVETPGGRSATGDQRAIRTTFAAVDNLPRLVVRAAADGATVSHVGVRILRRTPSLPWGPYRVAIAFAILAVGTAVLWIVQGNRVAREWVIVGMSGAILAEVTPLFGLAVLVLLACLYRLGPPTQPRRARSGANLWIAAVAILALCGGWKYAMPLFGAPFQPSLGMLAAPMGAAFFILRLIDAQLRWNRGEETDISFREYLVYALFPATLLAGPMQMLRGFRERRLVRITREDVAAGGGRMLIGLAKKLMIGDFVLYGLLYGDHFALYDRAVLGGGGATTVAMLITAFLFAAIDISAYADLAIGLARMHGYVIREDSNWPILASSLRDFWRRWHISVMEWCMTNVYVPVLIWTRSAVAALFVAMIAMGAWHQLSWPWLLWAVHFSIGLTVESWLSRRVRISDPRLARVTRIGGRVLALWFVISSHAFVQTDDTATALRMYRNYWLAPWR